MVTAAYFNNESDEKWLLVLLKSYISRLEDIQKVIRPTQYKESEQATFASHMIAASKLGYSTHDLNITSSSAFLDTYVMLLDDDRTQLLHLRAVIEMNVRKLWFVPLPVHLVVSMSLSAPQARTLSVTLSFTSTRSSKSASLQC